jgi:hypothetical protein
MLHEEQPSSEDERNDECADGVEWTWGKYKTRTKAMERYRHVGLLKRAREDHAEWYRSQRRWV